MDLEALIAKELQSHAHAAVDLSKRNTLLNLKIENLARGAKEIGIVDELPDAIASHLLNGKSFKFLSIEHAPGYPDRDEIERNPECLPFQLPLELPLANVDAEILSHHQDDKLQCRGHRD